MIQSCDDGLVDASPHADAFAEIRALALPRIQNAIQQGDWAFNRLDDVQQSDLGGRAVQHITTPVAPEALNERRTLQRGRQLREIHLGEILPGGNIAQRNWLPMAMFGHISHHSNGVPNSGVYSHRANKSELMNLVNNAVCPGETGTV